MFDRCTFTNPETEERCRLRAVSGGLCIAHSDARPRTIIDALRSRSAFGKAFPDLSTFGRWVTLAKAVYGLPLSIEELAEFRELTGLPEPRLEGYHEIFACAGRQSGKSTFASWVAAYTAAFSGLEKKLNPGDTLHVFALAKNLDQARQVHDHIRELLKHIKGLIIEDRNGEIILANGVRIITRPADAKAVRGYRLGAAIIDEADFIEADLLDLLKALRPAILEEGRLILTSSRAARGSVFSKLLDRFWAKDTPILAVKGKTKFFNPTFSDKKMARDILADPLQRLEYDPDALDDSGPFPEAAVRAVARFPESSGPVDKARYCAFIDTSSAVDSMALGLCHLWEGAAIVDLVRENVPPFKAAAVLDEYAELLKKFHAAEVYADRYAFTIFRDLAAERGLDLHQLGASSSDCYRLLEAYLREGALELPSSEKLIDQLIGLERIGDRITHREHQHDDVAAAVASAVYVARVTNRQYPTVAAEATVVLRKAHPIPEQEVALHNREEIEDNEYIFQEWLRKTEKGVCLPLRGCGEPELIEVRHERKVGKHPSDKPT